jgi:tetratricopeptide (TPR) repeat protein
VIFLIIKDDLAEAHDILVKLKKDNKTDNNYYFNHIYLLTLFRLNKYDDLLNHFNENFPFLSSLDALSIYAGTLYKIKLFDESFKVINQILYINKNFSAALVNKAKILFLKKRYVESSEILKNALKIKNRYADEINFLLSVTNGHLGLLNEMTRTINKISVDSEFYHKALFNAALIYYDVGKIGDAKKIFRAVNSSVLKNDNYEKWKYKIFSESSTTIKSAKIYLLLRMLPFSIIITAVIIFFIFLIFIKK